MEFRVVVTVTVLETGEHIIKCADCNADIHHICKFETAILAYAAQEEENTPTAHGNVTPQKPKRLRTPTASPPEEVVKRPDFKDFKVSPKKGHIDCKPCQEKILIISPTNPLNASRLRKHMNTRKHQKAKKRPGSSTQHHNPSKCRSPSKHGCAAPSVTKKKNSEVKSVVCPLCNKIVDASHQGMRNHFDTKLHQNALLKSKLVISTRPETLPVKTRTQRLIRTWFRCMAAAGVPILAGDKFRPFLQEFAEGGGGIPKRTQLMKAQVPHMQAAEKQRIIKKYRGQKYSVELDSSPIAKKHFFAVLLIPVNSGVGDMVRLEFPDTVSGQYTAEVVKRVMEEYELEPENCLAVVGDGASVNHCAFNTYLRSVVPNAKFVVCSAHSWNLVHEQLIKNLPAVKKFLTNVQKLFCYSGARKKKWRDFIEARRMSFASPVFFCKSRWSTYLKSARYWVGYFDEISDFVAELVVRGKVANCLQKLRDQFDDTNTKLTLLYQLQVLDHVGQRLEIELTKCESNTIPLAPYVLDAMSRMVTMFEDIMSDNELNTFTPVQGKTRGWVRRAWFTEGKKELVVALTAAQEKIKEISEIHPESKFLTGVRIFEPSYAARMMNSPQWTKFRDVDLPSWGITGLNEVPNDEWEKYKSLAEEVGFIDAGTLDKFWKTQTKHFPVLHAIALQNVWIPINSVEVERCFSVINSFFGKKRHHLSDNNTAVLMSFAFNTRRLQQFDSFDQNLMLCAW